MRTKPKLKRGERVKMKYTYVSIHTQAHILIHMIYIHLHKRTKTHTQKHNHIHTHKHTNTITQTQLQTYGKQNTRTNLTHAGINIHKYYFPFSIFTNAQQTERPPFSVTPFLNSRLTVPSIPLLNLLAHLLVRRAFLSLTLPVSCRNQF